MKMLRTITTGSNATTQYDVLELTLEPSASTGVTVPAGWTRVDEDACTDADHEHVPIYCMWHGQMYGEHDVGRMCLDCDKQWFFAPDWSSPECRVERGLERSSRLRLWVARLDRLISGWKWHDARTYKP